MEMRSPARRSTIFAVTGRWSRWAAGLWPRGVGIVVLTGCPSGGSGGRAASSGGASAPSAPPPASVAPYPAPSVPASGAGLVLPPVAGGPAAPPPPTGGVRPGADWTTYHGDVARTGYVPSAPDPAGPALAWQTPLDGAVYGS